jgi:ABC-type nitrate/sulfonate/bicarbonate transport system ATPase subunit
MKKQQFVAEIIGPAGAGKSTLSRALDGRDKTMRTGLSVWDMTPTLLAISFFLMLPTFFSFYRARRLLSWDEVKQLVRLKALDHLLDRETSKHYRTVLLNEGAVFTLAKLHAFGRGVENCWFEKCSDVDFNHWAKTLDAIIWLDAPEDL